MRRFLCALRQRCDHPGRRGAGFTLVEVSLVLVVAALLLGMAAKGLTLLDQSKGDQLVLQVRQLENQLNEYHRTHQRWPGDCDGNGRIDSSLLELVAMSAMPQTAKSIRAARFDFTATAPWAVTGTGDISPTSGNGCPASFAAASIGSSVSLSGVSTWISDFNVPYNDLKLAGQLSTAQPNRIAATHAAGDFMAITKMFFDTPPSGSDPAFNAIMLFNVPVSFARKLAVAMDGFDGSAAYKGRVRRLKSTGAAFESSWLNNSGVTNETQDSLINVAYFFDQVPLPVTYLPP